MSFYIEQRDCDLTQWTEGDPCQAGGGQMMEMPDSPTINWTRSGMSATRLLCVEYAERLNIARELLGGGELSGQDYVLHRPHRYPEYELAVCESVAIGPFTRPVIATGDDLNKIQAEYTAALLTVEYETPQYSAGTTGDVTGYDPANPVLATQSFDSASEFLNLPKENLYWDLNKAFPLKESPGRIFRLMTWDIVLHHNLTFPMQIFDWGGLVNQHTYYAPNIVADNGETLSFPPETLLANAVILRREYSAYGWGAYELEFSFMYRNDPNWNQFVSPDGVVQDIYDETGTVRKIYEMGDFSALLPTAP